MSKRPTDPSPEDTFVDIDVFEALGDDSRGREGTDWTKGLTEAELNDHKSRLRSVVEAQQKAEVIGSDLLIGW